MPRRKKTSNFNATKIIPSPRDYNHWSERELVDLAAALQRYGFAEIKKIAEFIQTKDESAVKHFLSVETSKVRQKIAKENGVAMRKRGGSSWHYPKPVELTSWPNARKWRRVIYDQLLPCVRKHDYSKILLEELIEAFYEEAEEPDDPQVINVKAVYKYLLDCIRGFVPAELTPIDSAVVLTLVGQLKQMHRDLDFEEEITFIKTFKRARPFAPIKIKDEFREKTKKRSEALQNTARSLESINHDGQKDGCSSKETVEDEKDTIMVVEEMYHNLTKHRKLVQSFNPLNVPLWTLVKEQDYVKNKCALSPRVS